MHDARRERGPRRGDVFAGFELYRLSSDPKQLRVVGSMTHAHVGSLGTVNLGTAAFGVPVTIRMTRDQGANRVDFQRGSDPMSVSYAINDSAAPITPCAVIESLGFVANCTDLPRPYADVAARFDNILDQ
jgi:hypothetical protein